MCVGRLLRMGGESLPRPVWTSVGGGLTGKGELDAWVVWCDGSRMGWNGGGFYRECLPSPAGGWIRLNVKVWWGREYCLV